MFDYMLLIKGVVVAASVGIGIASYRYFGMKQDNFIEQTAENVIKEETGMSVDLSPETPDTKK